MRAHASARPAHLPHNGCQTLRRRSLQIAALIVAAGAAQTASAQDWHWNAGNGDWSDSWNWTNGLPPWPTANVFLGTTAAAQNAEVWLDVSSTIANLTITDGMMLSTNHHTLDVAGNTVVSGTNFTGSDQFWSTLNVGGVDGWSFKSNNLSLSNGGRLYLDGGVADINNHVIVDSDSRIDGNGIIGLWGAGSSFVNNGLLNPGNDGGIVMQQAGGGRYDLDGTTGNGFVLMSSYDTVHDTGCRLRLDGIGLADAFSSQIQIGSGSDLNMNLTEGWAADSQSSILVFGLGGNSSAPARIRGGSWDFAGDIEVGTPVPGTSIARLSVESSSLTLRPQASIDVRSQARAVLGGVTTSEIIVEGGTYTVAEDGLLRFDAPTEVRGGTFTTPTPYPGNGSVDFNGHTTWNGNVTLNGHSRQNGDALVSGATVITADRFVMSAEETQSWHINNSLTINADDIGNPGNALHGTVTIGGNSHARMTINLPNANDYWTVNGAMNLVGGNFAHYSLIAGSPFHTIGDISVLGKAQITSDAWLLSGTMNIGPADADLRLTADTKVSSLIEFQGNGTLHNAKSGHMTLSYGADLSQVGLINEGVLDLGVTDTGIASVDRIEFTDTSSWGVDIGGYTPATGYDILIVSDGPASLGGVLDVRVIDAEPGEFAPNIGDQFLILTSLGGVNGSFSNDPVSQVGSLTYEWSVLYGPASVILRLDTIVPAPGSLALLTCGLLGAFRRRR